MKALRSRILVVAAMAMIALASNVTRAGGGTVADLEPFQPFFPVEIPPFHVLIPWTGPTQHLCAGRTGRISRRTACRATETRLDPSAIAVCAEAAGTVSIAAPECALGTRPIDLRAVRGADPASWFGTPVNPPPIIPVPPFPGFPPIEPNPQPLPFPFPTFPKELCQRGRKVFLREGCRATETGIDPTVLLGCVKRSGAVRLQASPCSARESRLDLTALRGIATVPAGFGPLVGLFPTLADLVATYPEL